MSISSHIGSEGVYVHLIQLHRPTLPTSLSLQSPPRSAAPPELLLAVARRREAQLHGSEDAGGGRAPVSWSFFRRSSVVAVPPHRLHAAKSSATAPHSREAAGLRAALPGEPAVEAAGPRAAFPEPFPSALPLHATTAGWSRRQRRRVRGARARGRDRMHRGRNRPGPMHQNSSRI